MIISKEAMAGKKDVPKSRTEFQIYIDWKSTHYSNVIDLTEQRLLRLVKKAKDPSLKSKLGELIAAYRQHKIAIAWQEGEPAWTTVSKG
jgi:hypothetical protein